MGLQVGDRVGTALDAMMAEGEHEASSLSRLSSVVESGGEQLLLRDIGEGDVDAEDAHRFDLRAVKVSDGCSCPGATSPSGTAWPPLSASEQDFRLLAESIGDVVRILDVDGVQRWVSPSVTDLLGYSPRSWSAHTRRRSCTPTTSPRPSKAASASAWRRNRDAAEANPPAARKRALGVDRDDKFFRFR